MGAYCAKHLEKEFKITLIDSKDYFEFTPGILRVLVEPEHLRKIQVLHNHYLHKADIVVDHVLEVSKKNVVTKSGKKFSYDYLIIGSGSSYNLPIKEGDIHYTARGNHLRDYMHKLDNAKSVLIIGGGLVGVELASEICTHFPKKKVKIVHSHDNLIERNHPKSIAYAEKFLKKYGVDIVFNERIKDGKGKTFFTEKGNKISADMTFLCTGIKPNYDFMMKNFKNNINERGQIKVNELMHLEDNDKIYAGGDVSSFNEEKTAQTAENHAEIIVRNILKNESGEILDIYRPKRKPMVISLGKNNGIFEYENIVLTGFLPALMKKFVEWKTMIRYK